MDQSNLYERELTSSDKYSTSMSSTSDQENVNSSNDTININMKDETNGNYGAGVNGKEKSPMCLVNELCRFNLITCRYELIDESGAAHSRIFSVLLKLGDNEEYQASAPSIRKAQHAAASLALRLTKFPLPSPKSERKANRCSSQITPTVELNVLAMKRREHVQYNVYEQPVRPNLLSNLLPFGSSASGHFSSTPSEIQDFRNLNHQRYHLVRGMVAPWYVATVMVGDRQFTGKGKTIQIARHAAAEEALKTLRQLPPPMVTPASSASSTVASSVSDDDDSKSPVSVIYEAAMKRGMTVCFEVLSESGPSHMPCFVIKCIVGNYSGEGRGVRKKTAKRRAAAAVLAELEEKEPITENLLQSDAPINNNECNSSSIPPPESSPLQISGRLKKKKRTTRMRKPKKDCTMDRSNSCIDDLVSKLNNTFVSHENQLEESSNNDIETSKTSSTGDGSAIVQKETSLAGSDKFSKTTFSLNPISRLIQLQAAKKESEPKFVLISEENIRRKEFTIQCSINVPRNFRFITATVIDNELTTFGTGSNKKTAKRKAAEEMLRVLGYSSISLSKASASLFSAFDPSLPSGNMQSLDSNQELVQCDDCKPGTSCIMHASLMKRNSFKTRSVKFSEDLETSSDNLQNLAERLDENLTELSQQSANTNKCGRQIAPGLLFVMSMNQTSFPMNRLMDTNSTVEKL